tara:strand:+ start:2628 stop:2858 length:231 start_codon:yes stop_codon:yes gene_type:complete
MLFRGVLSNPYISLLLAGITLWVFWRLIIESPVKENFGNGAMGPYAISTAAQAFATRPSHATSDRVSFRSLDDYSN